MHVNIPAIPPFRHDIDAANFSESKKAQTIYNLLKLLQREKEVDLRTQEGEIVGMKSANKAVQESNLHDNNFCFGKPDPYLPEWIKHKENVCEELKQEFKISTVLLDFYVNHFMKVYCETNEHKTS